MCNIAILYHPSDHHTEGEANAVSRGALAVPSVHVRLYTEEEAADQLDELDVADAIIFGGLTYEDGTNTPMGAFIVRSGERWTALAFKDKVTEILWASSRYCGDNCDLLVGLVTDVMQRTMFAAQLRAPAAARCEDRQKNSNRATAALHRSGSPTGSMDEPTKAGLDAAEVYGRRVAEIALKYAYENRDGLREAPRRAQRANLRRNAAAHRFFWPGLRPMSPGAFVAHVAAMRGRNPF